MQYIISYMFDGSITTLLINDMQEFMRTNLYAQIKLMPLSMQLITLGNEVLQIIY